MGLTRCMELARHKAKGAWDSPKTAHITLDPVLEEEFAKILVRYMFIPNLKYATTEELIEEIKHRTTTCKILP